MKLIAIKDTLFEKKFPYVCDFWQKPCCTTKYISSPIHIFIVFFGNFGCTVSIGCLLTPSCFLKYYILDDGNIPLDSAVDTGNPEGKIGVQKCSMLEAMYFSTQ